MRTSPWRLALALLFAAATGACSASTPAKAPSPLQNKDALARYLPLAHDTVYSYDTFSEVSGEHGLLVMRVRRPRTDLAELDVAGRIQRLYIGEKGVSLATGGYLLRIPLAVGAEWVGDFGKVKVTALDRKVRVPAGSFERCVETVEEIASGEIKKRTLTVYCPDVGIVMRETQGQSGTEVALERIELKSYGPVFTYDPTE